MSMRRLLVANALTKRRRRAWGEGGRGGAPHLSSSSSSTPFSSSSAASDSSNPGSSGLAQQVIDYSNALVAEAATKQEEQGQNQNAAASDARRRALDALASVAPALAGTGEPQCGVLLSASGAHAWLGEWREAAREAKEALGAVASGSSSSPLLPVAALAAVRAAMVAGGDGDAEAAAASAASSLPGLKDLAEATIDPKAAGSASSDNSHPLELLSRGRALAAAAMRAAATASDAKAAASAAIPDADAALPLLDDCARLAEQRAEEASTSTPLVPHIASQLWREVAADARIAAAQAHAAARRWPEAEEALSLAVKAGEAAAGGDARYPGLAAPLTLLGDVFARTARVTFAEGMYREAARLAGVVAVAGGGGSSGGGGDAAGGEAGSSSPSSSEGGPRPVHPSLAALTAWRYAQLLTALPRRETEAKGWTGAAERHWRQGGQSDLASALGALDCRTGRSASREGGVVSLLCRRLIAVEGA